MKENLARNPRCVAAAALLALCAGLPARADYSNTVMSFNPVAYWRLSETAPVPPANIAKNVGSIGDLGNGYAVLDVTNAQPGIVGTSFRFTDANLITNTTPANIGHCGSKVDVPYNASLNPKGPFTIEFWAKPSVISFADSTRAGVIPLSSMNPDFSIDANNRSGWLFYQMYTNAWQFRVGGEHSSYIATITGGEVQANVWHHIVGVYDGANVSLYVNGQKVAGPAPAPGFNPNTRRTLRMGGSLFNGDLDGSATDGNRGFDGWVDEVAVYASALNASEISAHYNTATTNNAAYAAQILASNPVGYWHLDEPVYTPPDPGALPVASNSGTLGAAASGVYSPGAMTGAAGPPFSGFEANNKASQLSGVVGNIGFGNPDGLNFSDEITLIAWVKPAQEDVYPTIRSILAHGYDDNGAEVSLLLDQGYYEVGSSIDGTTFYTVVSPMPGGDVGNWVFLAGTWDGTAWNLYRYDSLVASGDFPTGALEVDAPWAIGSRGDSSSDGRFFGGGIDEVAIFTNALSAAQIQQIFYSANVSPIITQAPQAPSGPVYEGSTVTFSVVAEGNKPLTYQWTKNSTSIPGQTGTGLTLNNLTTNDSGSYAVVVTNPIGSVTNLVALTVLVSQPLITQQPEPATRFVGANATFSVRTIGSSPRSYQWKLNDTNAIPGANGPDYTLSGVKLTDAGNYSCTISNPFGSTNSANAALTVLAAPTGYGVTVLADNPIAYWRLGETNETVAHDYWGGHDGEFIGVTLGVPGFSVVDSDTAAGVGPDPNSYVGGISGTAIDFSGTNSTFALEAWVNGPPDQVNGAAIICKGTGGGGEQFSVDVFNGSFRFYIYDASGDAQVVTTTISPDDTWQHVVAVYDQPGATMLVYVNGVEAGSFTPSDAGPRASTHPISIGSRRGAVDPNYDLNFVGTIDEVAIYNKALTADEVLAHYAAAYGPNTSPIIQKQPGSVTNYVSWTATLKVVAGGTQPLSYQWKKGTSDVPGANAATLTISPLALSDAGSYSVVVSNTVGTKTSEAATLTVLPIPTSTIFSPGLVLHLPLDGNALDTSGRNNNGTNVGATSFLAGRIGQALHYSTAVDTNTTPVTVTSSYVTLGVRPDLQFGSDVNFSVAYWVRLPLNYDQGDVPFICNAPGSTFSSGYTFAPSYGANGTQGAGDAPGGWGWSLNATGFYGENNSINDAEWHHLAHTFDRSGNSFTYLDGVRVHIASIVGVGDVDTGQPTNIGQDPTGKYPEAGEADIDDIGIWRRVLTPLEVVGIYLAGATNGVTFAQGTVNISIQVSGNQLQLSWPTGTLQSTDDLNSQFSDVPNQTNPFPVTPSGTKKFYRIRL